MSPVIIHFKSSKRKTLQSTDFLLETEMYQKDADGQGQEKTVQDITLQEHRHKSLTAGSKRQEILESISVQPYKPTASYTYTVSSLPTTVPPTATATQRPEGQSPLSSIAVQLVLGMLAGVCLIAVFLRCLHVNRQHHAFIEARHRNLRAAHAQAALHASARPGAASGNGGGTHLVPTNEMTLAGRLNMYQTQSGGRRHHYYPYQQEAHRDGALESSSSFVAPSYEHDVSPPPFLTASGKPPAYAEIVNSSAQPTPSQMHSTLSTPLSNSDQDRTSQRAE